MADNKVNETNKLNAIFRDLNADDPEVTEIESLCLQCYNNGTTRMLLTKIPFYKEVVVMSFQCDSCNWENNSLQPASKIQDTGILYKLKVQNQKDLSRVVVKTEWASVMIPELEFEIPAKSQDGDITTIEGIIERTCVGLNSKLSYLKKEDPESAEKLDQFVGELNKLKEGTHPFTFILRDCSGNSFVQNLYAPEPDSQLEISHFSQSRDECLMMGLSTSDNIQEEEEEEITEEVFGLPTNCYSCNAPCVTNMKVTKIPNFDNVVIWCTNCESCGYKTNEVKSSNGIQPLGIRATIHVKEYKDLTRDLLKSDTCTVAVKELELEAGPAAFRSCYSTVEGILTTIKEQVIKSSRLLRESNLADVISEKQSAIESIISWASSLKLVESNPFITGDSADLKMKEKLETVLGKIDQIIKGEMKATIILDDPCGNSGIQYLGPEDNNLVIENYKRTLEQDDELGILDMKVENYEES